MKGIETSSKQAQTSKRKFQPRPAATATIPITFIMGGGLNGGGLNRSLCLTQRPMRRGNLVPRHQNTRLAAIFDPAQNPRPGPLRRVEVWQAKRDQPARRL
jgi:hypothetical protein